MALFNIVKRRKYSFEILLKKAVIDPAYRTELYERILTEKLFVIHNTNTIPEGYSITTQGTKVQIVKLKNHKIPIFTSTNRIFDEGIIKEQVNFLELTGESLLKALRDKTLILNPYSEYAKEILPEEIERILDGTINS
ncbi:MAG: SseB family protein [Mucilaginibacter sp.]|uniref:SseB family protein n=1 Tax=Mucilaginibacter sp. TaxID=1882438 RepID=UPI0031B16C7B